MCGRASSIVSQRTPGVRFVCALVRSMLLSIGFIGNGDVLCTAVEPRRENAGGPWITAVSSRYGAK